MVATEIAASKTKYKGFRSNAQILGNLADPICIDTTVIAIFRRAEFVQVFLFGNHES